MDNTSNLRIKAGSHELFKRVINEVPVTPKYAEISFRAYGGACIGLGETDTRLSQLLEIDEDGPAIKVNTGKIAQGEIAYEELRHLIDRLEGKHYKIVRGQLWLGVEEGRGPTDTFFGSTTYYPLTYITFSSEIGIELYIGRRESNREKLNVWLNRLAEQYEPK